ncbi:HK97 family phage prohead protease [Candidatus Deianiraea vastatrix]|uniref:Phage prohead protease, HK97 family n=1 Tax=Candidatus Deianiraea vastatrix TaxID=2163644 RepID=A0A5B8XFS4_9RICK|nr:HK97 family phage prohead protease [Candidatus Deianiraea vastatrix]QED23121.1 Putative phage prohead protease, HK97 family [Candidatus Deianiraea vastatrix]
MIFYGYASVFEIKDSQNDVVLQGAFNGVIKNIKNIPLLWQHRQNKQIGNIMSLYQDNYGLYVKCFIDENNTNNKFICNKIKKGVLSLSIGYQINSAYIDNETNTRYLTKIDLIEVSIVSFGANPLAKISLLSG